MARATRPFALGDLWSMAEPMERDGLAGYGWGVAWVGPGGRLEAHHSVSAFRNDPAVERLGAIRTTATLIHLRRPSRLSTHTLPDTQPFMDPAGRFALGHNGDFRDYRAARASYQAQGRIHGRADSEVGARWLEDRWSATGGGADARSATGRGADLLATLHETMGGQANLALLEPDGTAVMYAGNTENPVFAFRLGGLEVAATGLYSLDRSFFRLAAPHATDRRLVRIGHMAALTPVAPTAGALRV
jgi:Glutamine amidotransferase domain